MSHHPQDEHFLAGIEDASNQSILIAANVEYNAIPSEVKTTLSIHTAAELSSRGRRVLLIDADPQGSSLGWSNHREIAEFTVVGMAKATIHKEIESLARDYDDVVNRRSAASD